ncbi:MAG: lipoyl(octanoyl) transferase LipB [Melioribacteraceae bacterium]
MKKENKKIIICDLGLIEYKKAWQIQKEFHKKRTLDDIEDILFICEHPHTYTLGKTAEVKNLIFDEQELHRKEITVFNIDRGGDITYHGPGQIVGYAILDLSNWKKDTHLYLRALEDVLINTCKDYGLESERNNKYTGVWIGDRKICAIGIKVSRWVTMHGFAFNVNTDLDLFDGIIPCGIQEKEVTTLSKELDTDVYMEEVKKIVVNNFINIFDYKLFEKKTLKELN